MRSFNKLLLLLLFVAITGCNSVGHNEPGIENFDQVSSTLFRGAQPTKQGIRTLAGYQVRTVINLRDDDDAHEAQMVREAGMAYYRLPLAAETVTAADADRFLALLATVPTPVFVHCRAGRDRTGLAIAAYRLRIQGWTEEAALGDLNDHGHFWLLFPKVRGAVSILAHTQPPIVNAPRSPQT